jgi:GTP pyrophosphokinase
MKTSDTVTTVSDAAPKLTEPTPHLITATSEVLPDQVNALARARAFAEPLIAGEVMETGENTLTHADAVAAILKKIGARKPCRRPFIWCTPACT